MPRIAFLDGVVELMSPSRPHESLKSRIGRLVEVWCLEKGVEFSAAGAWTLRNKRQRRGIEADECYVFGTEPRPRRPHLAIEVVWTSGRMNKLEICRPIGVSEVWVWRNERVSVHVLRRGVYENAPASEVLEGIDLDVLVRTQSAHRQPVHPRVPRRHQKATLTFVPFVCVRRLVVSSAFS